MGDDQERTNSSRDELGFSRGTLRGAATRLLNPYRMNLLLLAILATLVIVWFYYHLYLYFRQTLFIGIPLTLGSLVALVRSFISKQAIDNQAPAAKRWLASTTGRWYLVTGLMITGLFFAATASVYCEYDQASAQDTGEYQIEVKNEGQLYLRRFTVSSYDRVRGRPFFFHVSRLWDPTPLRFTITKPSGYASKEVALRPWSRVYLRVPHDFQEKKRYVLRILPGGKWLLEPPRLNESDESSCFLVVHRGDKKLTVDNVLLESVYLGADSESIESMLAAEPWEVRYNIMRSHLTKIGCERDADERARILTTSYRIDPTLELRPEDEIRIEVRKKKRNDDSELLTTTLWTVQDTTGIQNVSIR